MNDSHADNSLVAVRKPTAPAEPLDLERRMVAVLTGSNTPAIDLAKLIAEAELEIEDLDATATAERERALDPVVCPDPEPAWDKADACALKANRLRTLLGRLQTRHQETSQIERIDKWQAEASALEAERDALAKEWSELYPTVANALVDLFARNAALNQRISELHFRRPAGIRKQLLSAELIARKLTQFDRDHPSVVDRVVLPDWTASNKTIWPPPRVRDFSMLVTPAFHHPRYSADWGSEEVQQQREAEQAREAERRARYHAIAEREQAERIKEGR